MTEWLESFREATIQMSATQQPMLSNMHAVFHELQDNIKDILKDLPDNIDPVLKNGLVEAHHKLSDYFLKFDQSDYYHWAACESFPMPFHSHFHMFHSS